MSGSAQMALNPAATSGGNLVEYVPALGPRQPLEGQGCQFILKAHQQRTGRRGGLATDFIGQLVEHGITALLQCNHLLTQGTLDTLQASGGLFRHSIDLLWCQDGFHLVDQVGRDDIGQGNRVSLCRHIGDIPADGGGVSVSIGCSSISPAAWYL